jgi:hypothetical protein
MSGKVTFLIGEVGTGLLEYPVALFDSAYEPSWFNDELGKDIIKTIDKTDVTKEGALDSPFIKPMSPDYLSCGCKSVLLAAFHPEAEKYVFDGSKMGDNCYPVLFEVARRTGRELKIQVGRLLRQPWGEREVVWVALTSKKSEGRGVPPRTRQITGYEACHKYLAAHTHLFWKGEGYGTQG